MLSYRVWLAGFVRLCGEMAVGIILFDLEKEGRENLDMVQVQGSDGWPGGVPHENR